MINLKVTSDEVGNTSSVTNKRKEFFRKVLTA